MRKKQITMPDITPLMKRVFASGNMTHSTLYVMLGAEVDAQEREQLFNDLHQEGMVDCIVIHSDGRQYDVLRDYHTWYVQQEQRFVSSGELAHSYTFGSTMVALEITFDYSMVINVVRDIVIRADAQRRMDRRDSAIADILIAAPSL